MESLFVPQAEDGPEFEFGLLSEGKGRHSGNPDQCDCLVDAEPNPRVLKPSGEGAGMQFHLQPFSLYSKVKFG